MKPGYILYCASVFGAGLPCSVALASPPAYNIQLTLASEDTDGNDDTYSQLSGAMRYGYGISRNSAINLNADIYTRFYSDIEEKDRNGILAELIYTYIPTGGFTRPVYIVGLRQEFETFDESAKDLSKTSLILASSIRTSDRLTLTGGFEFTDKSSDIRNTESRAFFVNADLRLKERVTAYTNLKFQREDNTEKETFGSQQVAGQTAARFDSASSHLPGEPGYSGSATTGADAEFDNTSLVVGVNYFIDSSNAIDISYERVEYDSDNDISRDVLSFDYFFKF